MASVCYESGELPGLAEGIKFPSGTGFHATARVGGLAAYWGQQFQRYAERDCWEMPGCRRYADYTAMCEEIESYFRVVGGAELSRVDVGDGTLSVGMPRLLVGTPDQPDADLDAMRAALEGVLDRPDVECVDGRVNVCLPLPDGVELLLSDGRIVRARKVILAAGVVGSMGILLRSIPGIESAEFADHAPYMLYTFGSFGWLGKAPADFPAHFNDRTVALDGSSGRRVYASVYRMSRAPISLLLATFGLKPALRGKKLWPLADLARPIQVWTPKTVARYRIDPKSATAELLSAPDACDDAHLAYFRAQIRSMGVWSSVSSTPAGYGFHFHDLCLKGMNGHSKSAGDVANELFADRLCCVDASTMEQISCRPHTLTEMVHSVVKTRNFMQFKDSVAGHFATESTSLRP